MGLLRITLFIRIGENHDGLVEKVVKHPGISSRQPEVTCTYDFGQGIANSHPVFRVILALEANPNTEIERAELLQAMVYKDIADHLVGSRIPIDQAVATAGRVVGATTVEELEAFIKSYPSVGYERALTALIATGD